MLRYFYIDLLNSHLTLISNHTTMLRALRTYTFLSRWKNVSGYNEIRCPTSSAVYSTLNGNSNNKKPKPQRRKISTKSISDLESTISKTGRLPENTFELVFKAEEIKGKPSNQELLSLIPLCGELAFAELPEVKIKVVKKIWDHIKQSGVKLDVSHYNALLRIYLKNENDFSPPEILALMKEDNVSPNRVTYLHLITEYCRKGDLAGASSILEDMKKQSLALNENIFHSLIFGHCVVKDVEGAESVIQIMKEKNLDINSSTYATLLCGLVTCGDLNKFDSVLQKCTENNIKFRVDQLHDIIYYLLLNGQNSRAMELINSNSEVIYKSLSPLITRLLNRKIYDVCFQIINFYRGKNYGSLDTFEQKILSHLFESEPIENVRRIAGDWEKRGLETNLLTNVLYQTLKRKDFTKSLQILSELREMGQPIKELYFWPMVAEAANQTKLEDILHIIRLMKHDFNVKISKFFLANLIFNNYQTNPRRERFLMLGMNKIGVSNTLIYDAYISSCIYNKRTDVILQLSDFGSLQKNVVKISKYIAEDQNLEDPVPVVNLLQNLIVTAINTKDLDLSSQNGQQSNLSSGEVKDISGIGQEVLDSFILGMVSNLSPARKNFGQKILQELAKQKLPISKAAGEKINEIWNDSETGAIINELTQNEFDVSRFKKEKKSLLMDELDSNKEVSDRFLKCCKENMIDEAESIIKDHPNLLDEAFVMFMSALKKTNNEEKFIQYLKSSHAKVMENGKRLKSILFLERELINKGFLKEACEIMGKSKMSPVDKIVLLETLKPVFEKGSLEEIKMIINSSRNGDRGITLSDVIQFYRTRKDWDNMVKVIESLDYEHINDKPIGKLIIRHMINDGAMESLEKLIGVMEKKNPPGKIWLDLLFAYACVGNVKRAREYLDNIPMHGVLNMPCINYLQTNYRMRATEAMIMILMGDKRFNKLYLYEDLIEMYEAAECDPSKGLELWEQIQEENIVPSPIFLFYLWRLLKKKNVDIPFCEPTGIWMDCVINTKLPRVLQKQLLAQGLKENFPAIRNILKDGIRYGDVTLSLLKKILNSLQGKENADSVRNIIKDCIKLAEWKDAFTKGQLYEYAMKGGKSENSIVNTDRIPHSFLCGCLFIDGFGKVPDDAAQVILWAHFQEIMKDLELSKMYEARVENFIQDRTVLEEVLRFAPYLKDKNIILNFLISRGVFNKLDMTREANYVFQTEFSTGSSPRGYGSRRLSNQNPVVRADTEERRKERMAVEQLDDQGDLGKAYESRETVAKMNEEKPEEIPRSTVSV